MKKTEQKVFNQLEKAYEAVANEAAKSAVETLANLNIGNTDDIEKEISGIIYANLELRGV